MAIKVDNVLYQRLLHNCFADYYEGYHARMVDFHMHDYYEISLILEGELKVFIDGRAVGGHDCRLVLSPPRAPHFISRSGESLYRRYNIAFSDAFFANYVPEWQQLLTVFGTHGRVLTLTQETADALCELFRSVDDEKNPFRQRLLVLYLLSQILEMTQGTNETGTTIPSYIGEALSYIGLHYAEKILSEELARRLGVSRTTLMTGFRQYTGSTIGEYLLRCRVKNAERLLRAGETEATAADACGFCDGGALIRAFQKCYGMTPRHYLKEKK